MADYTPSPELIAARTAFEEAQLQLTEARQKFRAAVADELRKYADVTNDVIAEHLPWTAEVVRTIAREYDVPRKRQPTVEAIKRRRRKAN